MTIGQIVAIGFLVVMVALVLWNVRGHRRSGDTSDTMNHVGSGGSDTAGD